jgi:putative MATE family efflux protein
MRIFRKEIIKHIVNLAAPVFIGMLTQTFLNIFDTAMVGRLPENATESLAAIGLGVITLWVVGGFFNSISVGTLAITSRRFGEGNLEESGKVLFNSLVLSFFLGSIFSAVGAYLSPFIFHYFTPEKKVGELGGIFLRYRFIGMFPFLVTVSFKSFFDGIGRTKIFMNTAIFMNIINIFLCWSLVFGKFGLPAWGIKGAAVATTISSFFGTAYMILVSLKSENRRVFKFYRISNFSPEIIMNIVKLSIPAGIAATLTSIGFWLFLFIIGHIGTVEQAASNVVIQLASISFLPCIGLGTAAGTMVGQKLGSGNYIEAKRYGVESVKLGVVVMGILGLLAFLFPEHVLSVFTSDAIILSEGTKALKILSLSQVFLAGGIIFSQALLGAGASKYVMIVDVGLHYFIFVPLTYVFGILLHLGISGAWLSVSVYLFLMSLFMGLRFIEGSWRNIKV